MKKENNISAQNPDFIPEGLEYKESYWEASLAMIKRQEKLLFWKRFFFGSAAALLLVLGGLGLWYYQSAEQGVLAENSSLAEQPSAQRNAESFDFYNSDTSTESDLESNSREELIVVQKATAEHQGDGATKSVSAKTSNNVLAETTNLAPHQGELRTEVSDHLGGGAHKDAKLQTAEASPHQGGGATMSELEPSDEGGSSVLDHTGSGATIKDDEHQGNGAGKRTSNVENDAAGEEQMNEPTDSESTAQNSPLQGGGFSKVSSPQPTPNSDSNAELEMADDHQGNGSSRVAKENSEPTNNSAGLELENLSENSRQQLATLDKLEESSDATEMDESASTNLSDAREKIFIKPLLALGFERSDAGKLASLTLPDVKARAFRLPAHTHTLHVYGGSSILTGFASRAKFPENYFGGLRYTFNRTKRLAFSVGMEYFSIAEIDRAYRSAQTQFGLIYNSDVTTYYTNRLNYLDPNLQVAYRLGERWQLFAGMGSSILLGGNNTIEKSKEDSFSSQVLSREEGSNYVNAFSTLNFHTDFGVNYTLNPKLAVSLSYQHGLTDVSRNRFFTTNENDRNTRLNLALNYKLKGW